MIERLSRDDLTALVTDTGSAPMQIGAILRLAGDDGDTERVLDAVRARLATVDRLRQRLWRPPPLCGRPVWVDDDAFDLDRHVRAVACPGPGAPADLLALAADLAATRLPRDRPLWSATLVTGLDDGGGALVMVLHHVLTDGMGGLAVLGALVDEGVVDVGVVDVGVVDVGVVDVGVDPVPSRATHPVPRWWPLLVDAAHERAGRLRRVDRTGAAIRRGVAAVRAARPARAPRTSLNRPTGCRRQAAVVVVALDDALAAAHRSGGTVNDLLLVAVGGALARVAASRGEWLPNVVISVPVAHRAGASVTELGNRVGAVPVSVPTEGDRAGRVAVTACRSRAARESVLAGSAALGLVFRLLARVRLFQWCIDRQRLVTTFVTNLHGPSSELHLAGQVVQAIVPLSVVTGNVTVAFAALSYAGRLGITVISDPDAGPDPSAVVAALRAELHEGLGLGLLDEREVLAAASTP